MLNQYRLELGIKVYECSERVTKCTEDDCRKALAAPKSLGPCTPWMQGVHTEVGLGPAVPWGG